MRFAFALCVLDTDRLTLERQGMSVAVEPQVFDLIRLLVENAGRVVTRDEILETVWGGRIVSESAISARIAGARKAVGDDGKRQDVIRTIARRGLQMVAKVQTSAADTVAPLPSERQAAQRIRYTRNARGQTIAYAVNGNGPPLLYFGHNTSHLALEWELPYERVMIDRLSEHHMVVRFDPVGTGLSDLRLDKLDFADAAEDAIAVADAAGLDRFAAFTESGTCHAGLHMAARHPSRVTRLAMTGAYCRGRNLRGMDGPDGLRQLVAEGWSDGERSTASAVMFSYFPEGPLEIVQAFGKLVSAAAPTANALIIRDAVNRADTRHILSQVTCPVMLFHGRHDRVHPLACAQELAAGLPDCDLIVLDTANTSPLPGNAIWQDYMQTLLAFLRS